MQGGPVPHGVKREFVQQPWTRSREMPLLPLCCVASWQPFRISTRGLWSSFDLLAPANPHLKLFCLAVDLSCVQCSSPSRQIPPNNYSIPHRGWRRASVASGEAYTGRTQEKAKRRRSWPFVAWAPYRGRTRTSPGTNADAISMGGRRGIVSTWNWTRGTGTASTAYLAASWANWI